MAIKAGKNKRKGNVRLVVGSLKHGDWDELQRRFWDVVDEFERM